MEGGERERLILKTMKMKMVSLLKHSLYFHVLPNWGIATEISSYCVFSIPWEFMHKAGVAQRLLKNEVKIKSRLSMYVFLFD